MSWFIELTKNGVIVTGVVAWLTAQILKTIIYAIINKENEPAPPCRGRRYAQQSFGYRNGYSHDLWYNLWAGPPLNSASQ